MKGQVAIPETSEELEELLNDDGRLTGILKEGRFSDFTQAYIKAAMGNSKAELGAQMREQMQLGTQQVMQDWEAKGIRPKDGWRPGAGPALSVLDSRREAAIADSDLVNARRQAKKQGLFNGRALGAAVDDEVYAESLGAFTQAVYMGERLAEKRGDIEAIGKYQDYKTKLHNALAERIPSEGGFLVPEVLRSEILMVALESAVVRPRARIIPMDSLRVPLPAIDDTSHASSVYGGVVGFWTEEGAALAASAPSFQRFVLEAKKLTAYTTIPNELLQDSITPLDQWFSMFFPKAISFFEDIAFIQGTGVGEPQGFLKSPAAITVTEQTTNHVRFQDIAKMYSRMWPASLNNAVWVCSPDVIADLLQQAVTDPGGTTVAPPLWLQGMASTGAPGGGSNDGVNYRLMGRPLIVSEKMPSSLSANTATAGALTFVDLSYYLVGDRMTMQIASSDQYLFANDLVAYRIIERLDGRFWLQSAITPEGTGGSSLSPLVLLQTY
jgi:HK97 family phage major capsid protein